MSWTTVPFDEIISDSAFGPRFSGDCYDVDGNVATLRTTDISLDGRIFLETMPHARINEEKFADHFLKVGDLVISRSGRIGTTAIFDGYHKPVLPGAFLIRFRLNADSAIPLFYCHYFNSAEGQQRLQSVAQGAAQQNINITNVRKIIVPLPPFDAQKRIAEVLTTYDTLIATNQRRIALLEEAARRLYREWFVHLRFPGHEQVQVQVRDGVPAGWRKATLGEICDESPKASVQTGPFGSQLHSYDYTETGIAVVMPQDIVGDRIRADKIAYVAEDTAKRLERHTLQPLDIVFPRRGDIAKRALVEAGQAGYLCGTGCLRIRLADSPLHPLFLYSVLADPQVVKWIEGQAVGATMLNLSATILRSLEVIVPTAPVQESFVSITSELREQISTLETQNESLAQARDLLLPKLMSGQLDVSNIPLPEEIAA
ncbi:MAG: restriction endonuclease subunit S [Proteobacteria bacterium]|nr:restriction endonuclease subunit S [Pseudomonadota bacterium]